MRTLKYSINVTLDGCVDHRSLEGDEHVHAVASRNIAEADFLLFGRVTYLMMEEAWRPPASDAMPGWTQPFARTIDAARKFVVSRTLERVDWNSERLTGDLETAVRALKDEPGGMILTGGVQLPTALAALGLIDEYEFIVHPRVYGHGVRLLEGLTSPLDLTPLSREQLPSGAVVERYAAKAAA